MRGTQAATLACLTMQHSAHNILKFMAHSRFSRSIAGTRVSGARNSKRNHIAPHLNNDLRCAAALLHSSFIFFRLRIIKVFLLHLQVVNA